MARQLSGWAAPRAKHSGLPVERLGRAQSETQLLTQAWCENRLVDPGPSSEVLQALHKSCKTFDLRYLFRKARRSADALALLHPIGSSCAYGPNSEECVT